MTAVGTIHLGARITNRHDWISIHSPEQNVRIRMDLIHGHLHGAGVDAAQVRPVGGHVVAVVGAHRRGRCAYTCAPLRFQSCTAPAALLEYSCAPCCNRRPGPLRYSFRPTRAACSRRLSFCSAAARPHGSCSSYSFLLLSS